MTKTEQLLGAKVSYPRVALYSVTLVLLSAFYGITWQSGILAALVVWIGSDYCFRR